MRHHPSTSPLIRRLDREQRRAEAIRWIVVALCGLGAGLILALVLL